MGGSTGYALRFISGKYQGNEFPLKIGQEVIIGRGSEFDIVLVEDMISRKHAKIMSGEDLIMIEDLGSTNGTFVNGERIRKVRLQEGDRVLLGTSILKLVPYDGEVADDDDEDDDDTPQPSAPPPPPGPPRPPAPPPVAPASTMRLPAFGDPGGPKPPPLTFDSPSAPKPPPPLTFDSPSAPKPSPPGFGGLGPASAPAPRPVPQPTTAAPSFSLPPLSRPAPSSPSSPSLPSAPTASPRYADPADDDIPVVPAPEGQAGMTGQLEETPLTDLLDIFASSRKSGILVLRNEREGRLYLREGRLIYATLGNHFFVPPMKAAMRVLGWDRGSFELYPLPTQEIKNSINEEPISLLNRAMRQRDELKRSLSDFPQGIQSFSIEMPLRAPLRDLHPSQLETFQHIYNYGLLDTVLNKSRFPDAETYQHLAFFLKNNYIKAS